MNAHFVHVNLVAEDWRQLARFYENVFGCQRILPERDLKGKWLEEGTGLPGAEIQGVHLRLPGWGDSGPTLEIFQYNRLEAKPATAINRPGLGHIAFAVDDVEAAREKVLAAGGRAVGQVVSREVPNVGTITFAYVTDLEGNVVELARWSRGDS